MKLSDIIILVETITFNKEMLGNKEIIRFSDEIGGTGFFIINDGIPHIIDWHSIPDNKKYSEEADKFKRRGFATDVIRALKTEFGFNTFTVKMQSNDAMKALKRLAQKGVITPDPSSKSGGSYSEHYLTYHIN